MKRPLIVHPILFAAYPVLALYTYNMQKMSPADALVPLLIVLACAPVLWILVTRALHNAGKAAIVASALLLIFMTYRVAALALSQVHVEVISRFGEQIVFGVETILLASLVVLISRTSATLRTFNIVLNAVSVFLIAFPLVRIGIDVASSAPWSRPSPGISPAAITNPGDSPDIYYVILDGYARSDVLKERYDLDNQDFVDFLTERGFYVADQSVSNYSLTVLSLASSLNLSYLDDLSAHMGPDSTDVRPLRDLIHDSELVRFLRGRGYEFVDFSSGFSVTDVKEAEVYRRPWWAPSDFEGAVLSLTPIPPLLHWLGVELLNQMHAQRILYTLENLPLVSNESATPIFVFAHVMSPHPPFVFDEDGRILKTESYASMSDGIAVGGRWYMKQEEYVDLYRRQTAFVTQRVMKTLDELLASAVRPTVVILQADHGPRSAVYWEDAVRTDFTEALSILNAYYLPDGVYGDQQPYPGISPVNTFRIVLNRYFGTHLDLLEDRNYFSITNPYNLLEVTSLIRH